MDLASVVAALASVGVRVSGSTPNSSVQVDSSRACPTGLAGPEPSGIFHDPGQHFHIASLKVPQHAHVLCYEFLIMHMHIVQSDFHVRQIPFRGDGSPHTALPHLVEPPLRLCNLPRRGRTDSASAGRVPAEAQFTTHKCVDGRSRTFFFAVVKM